MLRSAAAGCGEATGRGAHGRVEARPPRCRSTISAISFLSVTVTGRRLPAGNSGRRGSGTASTCRASRRSQALSGALRRSQAGARSQAGTRSQDASTRHTATAADCAAGATGSAARTSRQTLSGEAGTSASLAASLPLSGLALPRSALRRRTTQRHGCRLPGCVCCLRQEEALQPCWQRPCGVAHLRKRPLMLDSPAPPLSA